VAKVLNSSKTFTGGDAVWSVEQFANDSGNVTLFAYAYADSEFNLYSYATSECKKEWSYVTVTFQGEDSIYMYINGELKSASKVIFSNTVGVPTAMRFGYATFNYNATFNPMDEFRLYNRKLTATAVADLYQLTAVGTGKITAKYRFSVYPNPTTNYIEFKGVDLSNKLVEVLNIDGKLSKVSVENNRLDVSTLVNGTYFILIKSAKGELESYEKIIKE